MRLAVLRADDGLGVGEGGERLIAFGGQEQALKIAAEAVTLIALGKERIKVLSVGFEGFRGWRHRQAGTHGDPPPVV